MAEPTVVRAPARPRLRHLLLAFLGFALAAALIVAIVRSFGIDLAQVGANLSGQALPVIATVGICLTLQFALSALKWMQIYRRVAGDAEPASGNFATQFFYVSLSGLFAQLLTVYLASILVRGFAERFHFRRRFALGASVSMYEQLFDVIVLGVVGAPVIALLAFGASPVVAISAAIAAAVLLIPLVRLALRRGHPLQFAASLLPRGLRFADAIRASSDVARELELDAPPLVTRLLALSLLRYLCIAARTALVAALLIPGIGLASAANGFAAIQLSAVFALTPGNIGITEWGWAGYGLYLGRNVAIFAAFALALRVVTMMVTAAIVVIAGGIAWGALRARR